MAFFDKMLNAMRLNSDEDDDDFYNDDYLDDEEEYEPPKKKRSFKRDRYAEPEEEVYERPVARDRYERTERQATRTPQPQAQTKVTPMRSVSKKTQGGSVPMEVCVIKPISVEDAREITETLLNGRTVVLNFEGVDLDVAQRIIDFTSGSCFAIGGNLQKISNYIFIVTPASVDISGDFQNIMGAFDASSIQTDI